MLPTASANLRIAIIGSGPAGFYTAIEILKNIPESTVDMYEKLPTPYGLVRYGVAPDHPNAKRCQQQFDAVGKLSRFNFIGNVSIGTDLPLNIIWPHYHSIIFAFGAASDKLLNIPGENLSGVESAYAFVQWYNGHPDFAHMSPKLEHTDSAAIIGHGNVSLDITRILLSDVDKLRFSDITEKALHFLSRSRIRNVEIFGRRTLAQASFASREVKELLNTIGAGLYPLSRSACSLHIMQIGRKPKAIGHNLSKGSLSPIHLTDKSWATRCLLSPVQFVSTIPNSKCLDGINFQTNLDETGSRNTLPLLISKRSYLSDVLNQSTLYKKTSLAFRSIGYTGSPMPQELINLGIRLDEQYQTILDDGYGRVLLNNNNHTSYKHSTTLPGVYVTGWAKNKPRGTIASTILDAKLVSRSIISDWKSGIFLSTLDNPQSMSCAKSGIDVIKYNLIKKGLRTVNWKEWLMIKQFEDNMGKKFGRLRYKLGSVQDILSVLDS